MSTKKNIALMLLSSLMFTPAMAYHFPWDQGHDTTFENPDPLSPPPPPEEDSCGNSQTGSPVYLKSGHLVWSEIDAKLAGQNPLTIKRVFNSSEPKDGPFGKGWTFSCETSLFKIVGTEEVNTQTQNTSAYILRLSNGRRLRFEKDDNGQFIAPKRFKGYIEEGVNPKVKYPDGEELQFTASGNILKKTDSNGNEIAYQYDEFDRVISFANNSGQQFIFTYGPSGRIDTVNDQTGRQWFYDYNSNGELISVIDPTLAEREYSYNTLKLNGDAHLYSQLTSATDATGSPIINVTYNGSRVNSYSEGANVYTYTYTNSTNVSKTDSTGTTWQFKLNAEGQKVETNISGIIAKTIRDENGRLIKQVSPTGVEKIITRDPLGRPASITDGRIPVTYSYTDNSSRPSNITVGDRATGFTYDLNGNITTITDAKSKTLRFEYDLQGRLVKSQDENQQETSLTYNSSGFVTSITNPQQTVQFGLDAHGRMISVTDGDNQTTTIKRDNLGRVIEQTSPALEITKFSYDAAGRLLIVTAPNDATETYQYDNFGRLVTLTRYDGSTENYTYRADNLVKTKVDPSGITTTYDYDTKKRLVKLSIGNEVIDYSYNSLGQVTTADNGYSVITYSYDNWGRLLSTIQDGVKQELTYNNYNEPTSWSFAGDTVNYQYDKLGQLEQMTTPAGQYAFNWDPRGYLVQQKNPDGLILDQVFNDAGQLTSKQYSGTYAKHWQYSYSTNGLLTGIAEDGTEQSYLYDAANRLTSANTQTGNYDYSYDNLGNRLDFGGEYDVSGKLLEDSTYKYTYDQRGNLIKQVTLDDKQVETFTYNDLARLVGYSKSIDSQLATQASYVYDATGRRISKTVNDVETRFSWNGNSLIAEGSAADPLAQKYTYGPTGFSPMQMTNSAGTASLVADHLSAPRAALIGSSPVWENSYSPYGVDKGEYNNSFDLNIRLPGQYADNEKGSFYNRFRDYNPNIGRYIQSDPIGLLGGINTYGYVYGSPINYTDSYGHSATAAIGGWISTDTAIPDPSDIAWPKWVGYGALLSGAVLIDWIYYNETSNDEGNSNQCPIPGTTPGDKTKGKTKNFDKPGGFDQANIDFDNLNPENIKDIIDGKGGKGRTGVLPDGTRINVRPNSSDGRPTVEIQNGKKKIKVRYY